jgi:hypothetical protein
MRIHRERKGTAFSTHSDSEQQQHAGARTILIESGAAEEIFSYSRKDSECLSTTVGSVSINSRV